MGGTFPLTSDARVRRFVRAPVRDCWAVIWSAFAAGIDGLQLDRRPAISTTALASLCGHQLHNARRRARGQRNAAAHRALLAPGETFTRLKGEAGSAAREPDRWYGDSGRCRTRLRSWRGGGMAWESIVELVGRQP